ncbi:MAG: TolC family outer membrane protein [Coxiellaceae bacterium]|jgi:outer membrane protein|nr:TolC family outer membrane protein [Coxiellaceae bacterium]
MKVLKLILFTIVVYGTATSVFAADLMDVYKKALANDSKFKAARSQWLADRETLAINRADLLPQLSAAGSLTRNWNAGSSNNDHYSNSTAYSLQLTQSIFNFGSWANVCYAKAIAKQAEATFLAAEEELLQRVSQAYFNVLLAKDVLSYARANKAAVNRLLIQAKHKYDVGLTAIIDLEDARKNYAVSVAEEITAINDLNNRLEQLAEITGIRYSDLAPLKPDFPLLTPQPADMEQWVNVAKKQNFSFIASRYDAIAARENVKVKNAGHVPTLTAKGGYDYSYNNDLTGSNDFKRAKVVGAGVELSVPLFQGGKVFASAKQADYQYQAKLAEQERSYRSVISETRQAYLGVLSNISKIKADKQAIRSSRSSLRATEANYNVGTRTMADILLAQTQLFNAQKSFAQDEYAYIMQFIKLKSLTGILAADDFEQINLWLKKEANVVNKIAPIAPKTKVKAGTKNSKSQTAINQVALKTPSADSKLAVLATEGVKPVATVDTGTEE